MNTQTRRRIYAGQELVLLLREYFRILIGNRRDLLVTLLFPVIASFITVWIAGENMFVTYEGTKSACFVLVSAAIWGGLFNSIQTIVKDRDMIKRNLVSGGMRLWCYTFSRAVLQFILCAVQSAILCTSFLGVSWRYGSELPADGILGPHLLLEYFISLLLLTYAADTMGLMISCIVKKAETASVLAPYILIVQLIFSGILFTLKGAADKVSLLMLSRWGMEALGSISNVNDLPLKMQEEVPNLPHEAEDMFLWTPEHLRRVWLVLLIFALAFLAVGNLLLHRVRKDARD